MSAPDITIAIPTRNRAGMLALSLKSALGQDFANLEVVVSDNASEDGTAELLAGIPDPRLRSFRQEKMLSMHENWNFCLRNAKGKYFLLLSDDDLLQPEAAGILRAALGKGNVKLAYSKAVFIDNSGKAFGASASAPEMESGPVFVRQSLAGKRQALPCATMHLTSEALEIGGYPEIGNATDLAMRLAVAVRGDVFHSAVPLAQYRLHPGSLTADVDKTLDSMRLFSEWAAAPSSPLSGWGPAVAGFCADSLFARAVASALRGDAEAARRFSDAAAGFSGRKLYYAVMVWLYSSAPVRAAAALRRRLMK